MADKERGSNTLGLEQSPEILHVGLEGIDGWLGPATIPVPTQIYRQHPTRMCQNRSYKIKPVGIGATTVDTNQRLGARASVVEIVQGYVLQL
jgi:hypothetical protein